MLNNANSPQEQLIVALDCSSERALELAEQLEGHARWLKVGMTLFYEAGPEIVRALKERGFSIFLDLKLHDIPHQVQGAVKSAVECGADIVSVHTLGGEEMLRSACVAAQEFAQLSGILAPKIVGITVLTSMDECALKTVGVTAPLADEVSTLAQLAQSAGTDGIVCSPQEVQAMRTLLGPDALIVTPGVRLATDELHDQRRVARPSEAIAQGASMLVVGRPISEAPDPLRAFEAICADIG